jgi:hypothetical protein
MVVHLDILEKLFDSHVPVEALLGVVNLKIEIEKNIS